jgi:hypothetical protein
MRVLRSAATTERREKKAAATLLDIAETPALRLTGSDDALYERHLAFDNVVRLKAPDIFSGSAAAISSAHYDHEPETRAALDFVFSDYFCKSERGIFAPLKDALLTHGDYYMHLADLKSYLEADARLVSLYAEPDAWARKAILNVAASGKFSSDRTIAEYAAGIWNIEPCPVS